MTQSSKVERVVVLMLENRSFDHMLGHLDHGGLVPVGPSQRNIKDVSNPDGDWCSAYFLDGDADVAVDPGHGFDDVVRQLTEHDPEEDGSPLDREKITNGGFAWNYGRRLVEANKDSGHACDIMGCHTADHVPALSTLAREFATCSRWFCSVPSETWPNRLFAHGAQSEGLLENDVRPYTHRTTFRVLSCAREKWAVYVSDVAQALSYVELSDAFKDRFNPIGELWDDIREGTLPQYSFIESRHFLKCNSQHPVHSVALGDALVRSVYNALAANPKIWESVLLIVTYDEHGGFYDRERPPQTVNPVEDVGEGGFAFDVLGVRVPAVVVSPFIHAGTVDDTVRDHAAIPRTVHDALGIDERLTARDATAESVLHLLTRDEPREPPAIPPTPVPERALVGPEVAGDGRGEVELDDFQQSLVELVDLLDTQHASRLIAPMPPQARPPFASESDMAQLVRRFQANHLGSRAERLSAR